MPRIALTDLGGSLNQGRPPSELGANEYTAIRNFYQFGSKLRRRGGMRRLPVAPFLERVTGLAYYQPDPLIPGGVDMIVAGPTRWGILVATSINPIPNQTGFNIASSDRRWSLFQYKNIEYGVRELVGLVRSDGTYVGPSGIAAPATAPTLADGGAGAIPAASFKGVYTFYNANTALESNPSPVSNTLVLGANRKIDWSGIGVSSNAQVTSRRLYRTLPDQSGEYLLVAEIPNNTATTYTGDNVLAQDLGDAVSFKNGTPPTGLLVGNIFKERAFVSDGKLVYFSQDGLIEAFDPDAFIPVFPDDGHDISGLHAYGDREIVAKTNAIHYLVGTDPDNFALLTLSDRHGCVSHHTLQSAEGYLFWLGIDNVYRSDGNNVTGIASVKLRDIIEGLSLADSSNAIATAWPELGWYVLSIPGYSQLIYNYRTDVWTTVPTATDIQAIGDFYDLPTGHQEIFVADDVGWVYRFHDTSYNFDDTASVLGAAITCEFDSRAFGAEASTKHVLERASILCPRYPEQVTLVALSEGAAIKTRTVSLDYAPRWKLYNLSTRHQAKAMTQLRLTYTGATAIELEGFALDIEPLGRPTMLAR